MPNGVDVGHSSVAIFGLSTSHFQMFCLEGTHVIPQRVGSLEIVYFQV